MQITTQKTQVLVPLNASGTLHKHFHVSVRMKPTNDTQSNSNTKKLCPWTIVNDHTIASKIANKESFQFDSVFGQQHTTQDIFNQDLKQMMANSLKGYNVTVLAYG